MILLDLVRGFAVLMFVALVGGWHHVTLSQLFLALGASVFPDWDFAAYFLLSKRMPRLYSHRQIFHYPLLYAAIMVLTPPTWWHVLPNYAIDIVAAELFSHFLADTFEFVEDTGGSGWGIAWLWPISGSRLRHASDSWEWHGMKLVSEEYVPWWWKQMKKDEQHQTLGQSVLNRIVKKLFRTSFEQRWLAAGLVLAGFAFMILGAVRLRLW